MKTLTLGVTSMLSKVFYHSLPKNLQACSFDKEEDIKSNRAEYEYYMTAGLNSNIKQDEFGRKHLNLCILLDISGSMRYRFENDENRM